jgi:hypothetical protein
MKYGRLADFFFVGLGVLPVTFLLCGYPELMVGMFIPLLLAACLFGGIAQFEDDGQSGMDSDADADADGDAKSRDGRGLTWREHDPRE